MAPGLNRPTPPAGYSGTPLAKKLGIGAGCRLYAEDPPAGYDALLAPLPPAVVFEVAPGRETDLVHLFTDRSARLRATLAALRVALRPDAAVWVSWPKKAAKLPTDITEDTIRAIALPLGYVDIKVCAVNAVWSGLKLVVRKELR
jgi:hypothetical protein